MYNFGAMVSRWRLEQCIYPVTLFTDGISGTAGSDGTSQRLMVEADGLEFYDCECEQC